MFGRSKKTSAKNSGSKKRSGSSATSTKSKSQSKKKSSAKSAGRRGAASSSSKKSGSLASAKKSPAKKKTSSGNASPSKSKSAGKKASATKKALQKNAKKSTVKKAKADKKTQQKPKSKKATTRKASHKLSSKVSAKRAASKKPSVKRVTKTKKTGAGHAPVVKPPFEAYKGIRPYLFTSYAHHDMKEVFNIIKNLHKKRYRIWYDEGIEPGNEWPEIVGKAIVNCTQFLVLMSPHAAVSRNVRNEINLAFTENKNILVVFLKKTNLTEGMKLQIGTVQFINKYELSEKEFFEKLNKVLDSSLKK